MRIQGVMNEGIIADWDAAEVFIQWNPTYRNHNPPPPPSQPQPPSSPTHLAIPACVLLGTN